MDCAIDKRALVIEEFRAPRQSLVHRLSGLGFQSVAQARIAEGLQLVSDATFDLILTGVGTSAYIKAVRHLSDAPVIAMTQDPRGLTIEICDVPNVFCLPRDFTNRALRSQIEAAFEAEHRFSIERAAYCA